MGTRSTIALEYADGTVEQVYCHCDGYLSHNGHILCNHYSDPFKLQTMIDLGDMSSLAPEVVPTGPHNFNNPQQGVCVFYGRDRGETNIKKRKFKNFADYKQNYQNEEYNYILRNVNGRAVWFVSADSEFVELVDAFMMLEVA